MNYIVVGGSNGIGASIAIELLNSNNNVIIYDCVTPSFDIKKGLCFKKIDLFKDDVQILKEDIDICDGLFITAGIGRVCPFSNLSITEIEKNIRINFESISKILFLAKEKNPNA